MHINPLGAFPRRLSFQALNGFFSELNGLEFVKLEDVYAENRANETLPGTLGTGET